jgi:hypothetical protein
VRFETSDGQHLTVARMTARHDECGGRVLIDQHFARLEQRLERLTAAVLEMRTHIE